MEALVELTKLCTHESACRQFMKIVKFLTSSLKEIRVQREGRTLEHVLLLTRNGALWQACMIPAILCLAGCETAHVISYSGAAAFDTRCVAQRVAISPAGVASTAEFSPSFGTGTAAGAGIGARSGAVSGAVKGVQISLETGPLAPAMATLLVPVITIAGTVGGSVLGAAAAVSKQTAYDASAALAASTADVST